MENFIIKQPVLCQVSPVIQKVNEVFEYERSKCFVVRFAKFQLIV
jgi:hypothetical protein